MRRAAVAAVAALLLTAALPAVVRAEERSPDEQQALADLARVIGESHALRQACEGQADQTWRDQMQTLLRVEAPGAAVQTRLAQAFNSGFAAGRSGFPACDKAARAEAARVAARGEALATRLGSP